MNKSHFKLGTALAALTLGAWTTAAQANSDANADVAVATDVNTTDATDTTDTTDAENDIVVVGNRRGTAALESASLVDLLDAGELTQGGAVTLQQSLFRLSPSFNFPQGSASRVGGGSTKAASLRGQNPDMTLVLVNGKRRHGSVATGGTLPYGGAGYADINTIPTAALAQVEVLLDGASAQYGSDAIAGVLNLSLRENSSGGAITATLGTYKEGDGETGAVSGWVGTGLGDKGFINLSADYSRRGHTDRSGTDWRNRYFRYDTDGNPLPINSTTGTLDPREPFGRDDVGIWGNSKIEHLAVLVNAGYDFSDAVQAYSWANFADTNTSSWTHPQEPGNDANIRAIFPDGYQPNSRWFDRNYSGVVGLKYDAGAIGQFDASVIYGRHTRDGHEYNLVSPSYGLDSVTDYYAGQTATDQLTAALDYNKDVDVNWLAKPLAIQAGASFRNERWWVGAAGDEQGWNNGGVPILDGPNAGQPARWGGVEPAIAPWDITKGDRQVWSAYIGADFHLTDKLLIDATVRGEHYSDFGWTGTGKVSARYDFSDAFALRGTVSNGYHAPTVGQLAYQVSGFAATWDRSGVTPVQDRRRQVQAGSDVALALGGGKLNPEKATNISAGFVLRPVNRASLTVDVYQIDISDRIVTSQWLTGQTVRDTTEAAGIGEYKSVSFFTNGLDTRTRGIDVMAKYDFALGNAGDLNLSAGFSHYDTKVKWVRPNEVSNVDLFQRNQVLNPEIGVPEYKIVLSADYTLGKFSASVNQSFYGEYTYVHPTNPASDETYGAKGYTNIELNYDLTDETRVTLGANNVFDSYPAQFTRANQTNGINRYSFIHPESANGAYYYARLNVNF